MITGIHHINIVVSNLDESIRFFEALGFSLFERKPVSGKWIEEVVGLRDVDGEFAGLKHEGTSVVIELLQYKNPKGKRSAFISEPNAIGIRHIALQVENINMEYERLRGMGVEFLSGVKENPYGKKMCYLKGPEGVLLELAEV